MMSNEIINSMTHKPFVTLEASKTLPREPEFRLLTRGGSVVNAKGLLIFPESEWKRTILVDRASPKT
jgi:hypothetical protein